MPVRGIGVDIVKVERLAQSLERFGQRMEKRIFTEGELAYCRSHRDPLPHLAARFAACSAPSEPPLEVMIRSDRTPRALMASAVRST